jgi:hypothetical protein
MAFREGSRAVEWISQQALESGSLFDESCGKGRKPERRERRDRRGKETKSEHQMDRYITGTPHPFTVLSQPTLSPGLLGSKQVKAMDQAGLSP